MLERGISNDSEDVRTILPSVELLNSRHSNVAQCRCHSYCSDNLSQTATRSAFGALKDLDGVGFVHRFQSVQ